MPETAQTAEEARQFLLREIYVPVFLEKLANDFNIVPQNEDDLNELLAIGGKLTEVQAAEQVKQADARTSFFKQANQALDGTMTDLGYKGSTSEETLIKKASAGLAARPEVVQAYATFQAALAQQLQAA